VARDQGGPLGESWQAWIALGVGVLAVTAHSALSIAVSVLMKSMVADFGWDRGEFALTMTARMIAMILVVPFAGQLTDRIGARRVLAAGALLMGIGIAGMSRVDEQGQANKRQLQPGECQHDTGAGQDKSGRDQQRQQAQ